MNCPRCKATTPSDARFCEDCGAPLELSCPQCGAPVPPGKKFCRTCGAALAPSSESAFASQHATATKLGPVRGGLAAPMAEERKQVTVLFADMKGSLEAIAGSDPEEVDDPRSCRREDEGSGASV